MRSIRVGLALVIAASIACSAILGLDPPPSPDAALPDASAEAGTTCAAIDGGVTTYLPFDLQAVDDAGAPVWEFFSTLGLAPFQPASFAGGSNDGRYIYLAGRGTFVARFDTQGSGFTTSASWAITTMVKVGIGGGGFLGSVFDGRYVYFVPSANNATFDGLVVRYDTQGAFASSSAWTSFDVATLATDGGASFVGFAGGTFDGRYVYFVPHNDGSPDGVVVRYDTTAAATPDGGVGFESASAWSVFDVSSVNAHAVGFSGSVFDGRNMYLVPNVNGAFDAAVHGGGSGIVARYAVDAAFGSASSWSVFDMTTVNGLAENFQGAAFDARWIYFTPSSNSGIATRFDTTASLSSLAAWSSYDTQHVAPLPEAGVARYAGAAFDGRFVYFLPTGTGYGTVARYDTANPFGADCAWSTVDLTAGDAGTMAQNFFGAVFDGEYLYVVPSSTGMVARFHAKTPASMPTLPEFRGSFF